MESRTRTDSKISGTSDDIVHDKSSEEDEEETSKTSTSSNRLTRLRTAAAAARKIAAARRTLTKKAKSAFANRANRLSSQTPVRRSSRTTPSSKKLVAEEQAAIDEAVKQKEELEAIKKKLEEPFLMETAYCEFSDQIFRLADVVRVTAANDNNTYYAKIVGFFTNKYAERFVSIRWLIPKYRMSHPIMQKAKEFNINLFNESFRDERLIPMEEITFVQRLPIEINEFGEPFVLYKNGRLVNILAEKPLSSMV